MNSGERFTVKVKQHSRGFFDQKERWNVRAVDATGTVYVGVFPAFSLAKYEYRPLSMSYSHTANTGEVYVKRVRTRKAVVTTMDHTRTKED